MLNVQRRKFWLWAVRTCWLARQWVHGGSSIPWQAVMAADSLRAVPKASFLLPTVMSMPWGVLAQGVAHVGDGIGTGLAAGANWLMGGSAPPDLSRTVEPVTYQENMNRMDAEFADGGHGRPTEGQDIDAQHTRIMDAVRSLGGGAIDGIARECGVAPSQIVQIMRAKGAAGW